MKVIYGIGKVKKRFKNTVLVIGVFDGLHIGHQALIRRAIAKAKKIGGPTIVLTFDPHPAHVLRPKSSLPLIVSLPYRLKLIESLGADMCVVQRFTPRFSQLSPQYFIREYLVKQLKPKEIFVGDDFRFGQDRSGSLDFFKEAGRQYGFKVGIIRSVKKKRKGKVGSSMIRDLIREGELSKAKKLLGRNVSIMGKVKKGDARGKTLGFPTANIYPQTEVLPPEGAYAVTIKLGTKSYQGMANIGRRPSFHKNKKVNIEVHIFQFQKNLYGKMIIIEFVKRIRNEIKFRNRQELINQLNKDRLKTLAVFR